MKKLKSLILLLVCVVLLSGCMKSHTTMKINSDKSMDYEQEVLIHKSLSESMGEDSMNADEYKKKGYDVKSISEGDYVGFLLSKHFENIDDMANNKGEEVTISDFLNDDFNSKVVFKMEKGFLKNTYTASFKYESAASDYQNEMGAADGTVSTVGETEEAVTTTEEAVTTTEETTTTETTGTETTETTTTEDTTTEDTTGTDTTTDSDLDMSGLGDMMTLAGEMEFTYKVVLPTKAGNNNASKVSDDGKTLTWNLATDKESKIEFSFSLYNMTNLIIVGGGALLLIIIIIVVIVVMKKKKASSDTLIHTDYDPSIANNVPQDPNATMMSTTPETAPMTAAPEMPQTDNLQFNLPTEETQVNVAPQEPQFVTPAVEDAVNSVTEAAPAVETPVAPAPEMTPVMNTPVAPMPEAPTVTIPEAPTVVVPEAPTTDQTNNLM